MTHANEPSNNIVDLGQRQDPRNERMGDLLAAVRSISAKRLQALAGGMFENVDDALFDLAEKAESNAVQTQYFDGMREVRKKRALVERVFLENVARGLSDFAAGRRAATAPRDEGEAPRATGDLELSLVGDNELEESLAIASMVSKAENRLGRPLYAVNQRLSVICGGNKVEDASNPIGPGLLGHAFRLAMRELTVETRVKLIVYKLFDRYVMAGLDPLYDEINAELVRAGVLPQLRHEIPGRRAAGADQAASAARVAGAAAAGNAAAAAADYSADETAEFQAEFLHTLNTLLSARRGHAPVNVASADGASLSPAELLGALSLLQGEVALGPPTAAGPARTTGLPGGATPDVAQLKEQLLQQLARLRGDAQTRMSGADEDTIDLVGMLFEFILQDRNLPAEMQVLLARLQIPYLKAAILDRRMFAHSSHPARRLLDALADAAKGWSEESDRDQLLYGKMRSIVESLLQEFDDDIGIFVRLQNEIEEFLSSGRKRAELAEQRVAEATRGREKLQQARRRAAQEILGRIENRELPELIHGILTRAWANYLVLTLLRQGEDSQEFRVALRFVDDFVWSAAPKRDEGERQRLRQLLPLLERSLRHGLATVAFQDADVENLMNQLNALYRARLGEAQADNDAAAVSLPIPNSVEVMAAPGAVAEEAQAAAAPAVEDRYLEQARALKVGSWLEFNANNGSGERAKLSWISPISGKYLFVNRRGLKVADKTSAQLAVELANGSTAVLEELPLFDRALDAIVARLRQAPAAVPHAPTGPPTD
ncbi:MAG TPA: DUF1631 domain-containing protein [Rhodanobacteraceae bacterium]|nr:DUF1631 domain-containing protein [Rhodanobacteraceae bacterium]